MKGMYMCGIYYIYYEDSSFKTNFCGPFIGDWHIISSRLKIHRHFLKLVFKSILSMKENLHF